MKTPITITTKEWQEIMALPRVRDIWELEDTDTIESFTSQVFGAKFNYAEKSPDEPGNLYIITSGNADTCSVMVKRMDGTLFVEE
jgi:hypothetical protein